ncbi:unnamed protein product [Rotaria sp. Silwood1]|nr:unnamed protein product [Rotaria sp. Silwood1]CAF1499539.1 unnamed protein product [Rotaria sp. Silwood1]CAF3623613.1 unnamed protein product [Rotaria sp. Silwood1]CAF4777179.1 unnamed protein product [Rotaria sp. Silwood1]CAF4976136.1 unnamed protein product [Rotaria sp. Silwood1]
MSISTGMILPDGKPYSSYSTYNFSYDSDRGLVALKGEATSIPDGQKSHWWIIENMKDGQTYTIDQDSKKCYKSIITLKPLYCIPETAVYQYSSMYGYGDKQIIGDTWLITKDEAIMYFTVSGDGQCIPLNGHNYSQNPATVNSTTIANFVPKVLDPSAFDIPEECKNTT